MLQLKIEINEKFENITCWEYTQNESISMNNCSMWFLPGKPFDTKNIMGLVFPANL